MRGVCPSWLARAFPSADKDPEKRAMSLLVLLKPWPGDIRSLLDSTERSGRHRTWSAAFEEFFSTLQLETAVPTLLQRPATFSAAYWAHRSLAVIQKFDNMSMRRIDVGPAGGGGDRIQKLPWA